MNSKWQDIICTLLPCVVECMHVHASDRKLTEAGSAKFFVKENGDSVLQNRGVLNDREIRKIQDFIKQHYKDMYIKWLQYSEEGFYKKMVDYLKKVLIYGHTSRISSEIYYQFTTFEGKSLDMLPGILQAQTPALSIEKPNKEIPQRHGVSLSPNKENRNAAF